MGVFDLIESLHKKRDTLTPKIDSFSVKRDFRGYKSVLNWEFNKKRIIGFRVYRSRSKKVLLNKNYSISQFALERLSSIKSFHIPNSTLYDKQVFSQNSMLKFEGSKSSRYTKTDETNNVTRYEYKEIGFVKRNRNGLYEFEDKQIKLGETYYYIISAIGIDGFESEKSNSVTVRIEDLDFPDAPQNVNLTEADGNIQIEIGSKTKARDVRNFEIYRRDATTKKNFEKIGEAFLDGTDSVMFFDFGVLPGKRYEYKVYSVDLFGNLSLGAKQENISYLGNLERRLDIPNPKYEFFIDPVGRVVFKGFKNSNNIIGYRFERRDAWKFEQDFKIKTSSGKTWPSSINFEKEESVEFIDNKVQTDKVYQYRISSIKKNGQPATFSLTPHFRVEPGYQFPPSGSVGDQELPKVDFIRLKANATETKQKPIYTRIQWEIKGEWEYLLLEIRESKDESDKTLKTVKIDNLPNRKQVFINNLKKNKQYILTAKIYNVFDDLVGESNSAMNRVRISL